MKVLIVGAHGKIGKIISKKMSDSETYSPVAFIRKEEQKAYFNDINVPTVVSSLEYSIDALKDIIKDFDAVVFTAGSGGSTGDDKTLEIDLDGAVKTMIAAKDAGVNRYVIVSAAYADDREFWNSASIKPYYIAKHYADLYLKNSGLDYTILRPVALTDDPAQDSLVFLETDGKLNKQVSRENVANLVLEVLPDATHFKKVHEFSN